MAIWTVEKPTPDEILTALDGVSTKPDALAALTRLGLSHEQAGDAIEIVGAAKSRSALLFAGMAPRQFEGDFEDDPLLQEGLRRAGHVVNVTPVAWRAYAFLVLGGCILLGLGLALCAHK